MEVGRWWRKKAEPNANKSKYLYILSVHCNLTRINNTYRTSSHSTEYICLLRTSCVHITYYIEVFSLPSYLEIVCTFVHIFWFFFCIPSILFAFFICCCYFCCCCQNVPALFVFFYTCFVSSYSQCVNCLCRLWFVCLFVVRFYQLFFFILVVKMVHLILFSFHSVIRYASFVCKRLFNNHSPHSHTRIHFTLYIHFSQQHIMWVCTSINFYLVYVGVLQHAFRFHLRWHITTFIVKLIHIILYSHRRISRVCVSVKNVRKQCRNQIAVFRIWVPVTLFEF